MALKDLATCLVYVLFCPVLFLAVIFDSSKQNCGRIFRKKGAGCYVSAVFALISFDAAV